MTFPYKKEEIYNLQEEDLSYLAELDSKGLLVAHNEKLEDFKQRLLNLIDVTNDFNKSIETESISDYLPFLSIKSEDRVDVQLLDEATKITEGRYKFSINWVPSFFSSKGLGLFGGACAISFTEIGLSIFLIRNAFKDSPKWIIYKREELLSHELCHIARMPLQDMNLEEHFAYNISFSAFRRYIGNCFQTQYDAIFFFIPIFIMLLSEIAQIFLFPNLWIFPFVIFAFLYPTYLLIKNHYTRKTFFKAEKKLKSLNIKDTYPILFRSRSKEIAELAKLKTDNILDWINDKATNELRWKIIKYRFLNF